MNGFDLANHVVVEQFQLLSTANHGGALRSHLRDDLGMPLGKIREHSIFIRRVSQWFLAIHMLAHIHGAHGDWRMHVIRRGHRHRVKFISQLVKHFAPIIEPLRLRKFRRVFFFATSIHIAQRDNVHIWVLG